MLFLSARCKLHQRSYGSAAHCTPLRYRSWSPSLCRQTRWRKYFTPSVNLPRGTCQRFQGSQAVGARSKARSLATATDNLGSSSATDIISSLTKTPHYTTSSAAIGHHLPASNASSSQNDPWKHRAKLSSKSDLPAFHMSNLLFVNNQETVVPRRLQYRSGIGGDTGELHQNLHACLRVGRLDRAAAVIRRLSEVYHHSAPELTEAYNQYLEELVNSLDRPNTNVTLRNVQHWFEVEMRSKAVKPSSRTFGLLFKAAFAQLEGSKLDRAIRRYMDLTIKAGPDVLKETIYCEDYTDSEWTALVRSRPDLFNTPVEYVKEDSQVIEASTKDTDSSLAKEKVRDPTGNSEPLVFPSEIRPVNQKGLGLQTLKKSLSIFSELDERAELEKDMLDPTDAGKSIAQLREERLEEDAVEATLERWREEHIQVQKLGVTSALQSRPLAALMWQWQTDVVPAIKEELKAVRAALDKETPNGMDPRVRYGAYLETLTPEQLVSTSIVSLLQVLTRHGAASGDRLARVASYIGQHLESEAHLQHAKAVLKSKKGSKQQKKTRQHLINKISKQRGRHLNLHMSAFHEMKAQDADRKYQLQSWPVSIKIHIGALMLSKITELAKMPVTRRNSETGESITQLQPAFHTKITSKLGRRAGVITIHPDLVKKIAKEPAKGIIAKRLPMVIEPKPWTGYREGGYLRYPVPIVRSKEGDDVQKHYIRAAIDKGDMDQVFVGLDSLGKTPWKINRAVLDVVVKAWNDGEAIGDIAPGNYVPKYPPEPTTTDKRAHWQWRAHIAKLEDEKSGHHSNRCFQNFQLEIARSFANETFYFPHNMDFRGRAYPIPPILNHMGADLARGLLMFGEGKPLGYVGLRWLKIHLANLYGYDKASLQEREEFTMKHLKEIYESAANPLGSNRWWLKAESPWQCLSACIDLKNALESSDPTQYVSHVPVHQDGTCNGLQHYAALGGDMIGARQVNLEPGDRPADIYTGVAEKVKEEIEEDAAMGGAVAKVLDGKITRKVVKQTVMTNVYGVTYAGAREQVRKQLEELMPDMVDTPEMNFRILSSYVAKKIFKALSYMFEGAHHIQHWLAECANRISTTLTPEQIEQIEAARQKKPEPAGSRSRKVKNPKEMEYGQFKSPVIWTTPLKMPVVQPYRVGKPEKIATGLQYISISRSSLYDPISKRRQLQGFPPNFIHSLDATHMLLSALQCQEAGITFAAVHDSFWTHACEVPTLGNVLRSAFVRMHSEDIMGRLREEFEVRYRKCLYLGSIPDDSVAVAKIRALRKGKKRAGTTKTGIRNNHDELLAEWRRQQLLRSPDPEQQRKGREMVTPASLAEECGSIAPTLRATETRPTLFAGLDKESDEKASVGLDVVDDGTVEEEEGTSVLKSSKSASASAAGVIEEAMVSGDQALDHESAEDGDGLAGQVDGLKEEAAVLKKKKKKRTFLWLPMQVPEVPQKGEFDVSRLNKSQYFFS